jgi:hypothetical protein
MPRFRAAVEETISTALRCMAGSASADGMEAETLLNIIASAASPRRKPCPPR